MIYFFSSLTMDNVDSVMIMTLRQVGCSIDEEITSIDEFTPEVLMHCVATILNMIDESLEIPLSAPPEGPRRFKHSNRLALAMKVFTWHSLLFPFYLFSEHRLSR